MINDYDLITISSKTFLFLYCLILTKIVLHEFKNYKNINKMPYHYGWLLLNSLKSSNVVIINTVFEISYKNPGINKVNALKIRKMVFKTPEKSLCFLLLETCGSWSV